MISRKMIPRIMFIFVLAIATFTLVTVIGSVTHQDGMAVLVRDGPESVIIDEVISKTLILPVEATIAVLSGLASQDVIVLVCSAGHAITINLNGIYDRGHFQATNAALLTVSNISNSRTYNLLKEEDIILLAVGTSQLTEYGSIGGVLERLAHPI